MGGKGINKMEKVQFQTNIGERVALKYATGVPKPASQEGYQDQVLFTLCDGRVMYLPVFAADLITRVHGMQPGEDFVLGKYEVKEGQRKFVRWRVDAIGYPQTDAPPDTPMEANLRRSAEIANARKPGAPVEWPQAVAPPPARAARATKAPVSATPPAPTPAPRPAAPIPRAAPPAAPPRAPAPAPRAAAPRPPAAGEPPPTPTPAPPPELRAAPTPPMKLSMDAAMLQFLLIAGRQTKVAEMQLGAEGGSVRFDSRDVAALATTLLINAFNRDWISYNGGKP
jgi:hypothetical protein